MDRVVVEKQPATAVIAAEPRESTGSNAVWALAMVIIVALIVGALYYSGALKKLTSQQPSTQKINVEVGAPAAPASR
jgi:hypothetical protein